MSRRLIVPMLMVSLCLLTGMANSAESSESVAHIQKILQEHPELVLEALRQRPEEAYKIVSKGAAIAQEKAWANRIKKATKDPLKPDLTGSRVVMGAAEPVYTIVIYTDFSCGACAANERMIPDLIKKHPDQIKAVLKHYPSDEFSRKAALYFEAIGRQDQGKAWEFEAEVFKNRKDFEEDGVAGLQKLAEKLDLDQKRLAKDLADPALEQRIKNDEQEATNFRLGSTPSYLINGVPVIGAAPVSAMEKVIKIMKEEGGVAQSK